MARGGPRTGNPGTPHPNRSDLDIPKPNHPIPTGQTYGQAGAQQANLSVVPSGRPGTANPGRPNPMADTLGNIPKLSDPSMYASEPVTTGLPIGPGAGPESMMGGGNTEELAILRAIFAANPSLDLLRLIQFTESGL